MSNQGGRISGALAVVASVIAVLGFLGFATYKDFFGMFDPSAQATEPSTGSGSSGGGDQGIADAAALEHFVSRYYGLLPDDTDSAWALLADSARKQGGGREKYDQFYGSLSSVTISGSPRAISERVVRVTLSFAYKSGKSNKEVYEITMTPHGDSYLISSYRKT